MAGSTVKLSITLPRELAEKIRERTGPGEVSAYIAAALQWQVERDSLDDYLTRYETEHGPIDEQAVREKLEILRRAHEELAQKSSTAA